MTFCSIWRRRKSVRLPKLSARSRSQSRSKPQRRRRPPPDEREPATVKDTRVSRDPFMNVDGTPKPGGFKITAAKQPRRRTVL